MRPADACKAGGSGGQECQGRAKLWQGGWAVWGAPAEAVAECSAAPLAAAPLAAAPCIRPLLDLAGRGGRHLLCSGRRCLVLLLGAAPTHAPPLALAPAAVGVVLDAVGARARTLGVSIGGDLLVVAE